MSQRVMLAFESCTAPRTIPALAWCFRNDRAARVGCSDEHAQMARNREFISTGGLTLLFGSEPPRRRS